jgi:hypothetical protein
MTMESADRLLSRLSLLDIVELREQWFVHFNNDVAQKLSAKLLRLAIAYKVQELEQDASGRCDAIREIAERQTTGREEGGHGYAQHMRPGTRLLREYKGKVREVLAVKSGMFVYDGQIFKSLTEVATKIVGRHRSGTVFFGLRGKQWRSRNG